MFPSQWSLPHVHRSEKLDRPTGIIPIAGPPPNSWGHIAVMNGGVSGSTQIVPLLNHHHQEAEFLRNILVAIPARRI